MRRALAAVLLAVAVIVTPGAAWAAPTTQVIQGSVLRLVSVADWAAAGSLLPGQPVQWDIEVSADAPDPGVIGIAVSATGEAHLLLDISTCAEAWTESGCPVGATALRTRWDIPRDGVEVPLLQVADTETTHLRLAIVLDPAGGSGAGSTDVRVHAQGAGETVVAGSDGALATTGLPSAAPWIVGAGAGLIGSGAVLVLRRRRAASWQGCEMRSRERARILAGVVGLAVLLGVASSPSVQMTDAAFTDSEYATRSFTASTLATPVVTSCTVTSFLGTFTGFTITWTSPYLTVQQRLSINNVVVDNSNVTQSGSGPYTYSSTISSGLLNTLLGSLLGSTNTVKVESIYAGTSWVSPAATRTLSVGGLLGLGGNNTCT